jgi:hypothetical protein
MPIDMRKGQTQQILSIHLQPKRPQGSILIGGKKIKISMDSIKMKIGDPAKVTLRKLRQASKKSLFPLPALTGHG